MQSRRLVSLVVQRCRIFANQPALGTLLAILTNHLARSVQLSGENVDFRIQDEDPENLVLMVFGAALAASLLDLLLELALILYHGEGHWHLAIKAAGAIDGQAHPE